MTARTGSSAAARLLSRAGRRQGLIALLRTTPAQAPFPHPRRKRKLREVCCGTYSLARHGVRVAFWFLVWWGNGFASSRSADCQSSLFQHLQILSQTNFCALPSDLIGYVAHGFLRVQVLPSRAYRVSSKSTSPLVRSGQLRILECVHISCNCSRNSSSQCQLDCVSTTHFLN